MARRYVRLASHAMRRAGRIPPRGNPTAAANFALRNTFRRLRGRNGYWRRNYYRYRQGGLCPPCPPPEPCPACPTCAQLVPQDTAPAEPVNTPTPGNTHEFEYHDSNEMEADDEFGDIGEMETHDHFESSGSSDQFENGTDSEGENYESDNESSFSGAPIRGRWVRRGRRIILYGL